MSKNLKLHVGKSPHTTKVHVVDIVVKEIKTDIEKPIQGSTQPNLALQQSAKNMQNMMAQMTTLQQERKMQNEEIKARLEILARSHQGENGDHHKRNRNIEMQ